jgi:hypothetical protein
MNSKLRLDVIAIVVALAAAVFSGLQWAESRRVRELSFHASVGFNIDADVTERRLGIAINNVGPGVALFRSISYYVDRMEVVGDTPFNEALNTAHLNPEHEVGLLLDPGEPMAVGETIWLIDYRGKNKDEKSHARDFVEHHLAIRITYCSLDGQCKTECSTDGSCSQ